MMKGFNSITVHMQVLQPTGSHKRVGIKGDNSVVGDIYSLQVFVSFKCAGMK